MLQTDIDCSRPTPSLLPHALCHTDPPSCARGLHQGTGSLGTILGYQYHQVIHLSDYAWTGFPSADLYLFKHLLLERKQISCILLNLNWILSDRRELPGTQFNGVCPYYSFISLVKPFSTNVCEANKCSAN